MPELRRGASGPEGGVALLLVLIFSVLLFAIVAELVTTARTDRFVGENDVLIARMDNHMRYCLGQVEEMLLTDLASAAAGEGGAGAGGGLGAGALPGGLGALGGGTGTAGGEEGEEAEPEASSQCDGSQDAWYEPTAYADGDITTYVWCEDENAKFNVLSLVSPDEEFARESRERFVRLIDTLRAGTEFDKSRSDGELIATALTDWMSSRTRTYSMPRPRLKSDSDTERTEISLPLHLDELMLLRGVDQDLFYDKVLDGRLIPGLESVLTVYTSLAFDPGDPNDIDHRPAAGAPGAPNTPGGATGQSPVATAAPGGERAPLTPQGVGIKININTAPRPVLRCLFTPAEMSDLVLDAILRYRNEEVEEIPGEEQVPDDYLGSLVATGEQVKHKVFTDLAQLDEIPEYMNMPDPTVKDRLNELCGVHSDVFSIHMASLHKRDEERRVFVMRRRTSVVVRIDDGEEGYLHPLILLESRHGLRVKGRDLPDEDLQAEVVRNDQMDWFSQEEKAWNPFLLDFYLPREEREHLYSYHR